MGPVESNSMAVSRNAAVGGQSTPATSSCMPAPRPPALWYCCARDCAKPVLRTHPQTANSCTAFQIYNMLLTRNAPYNHDTLAVITPDPKASPSSLVPSWGTRL